MPAEPLQLRTEGERDLVITRSFAAPRQLVFDAHTKPALLRHWLLGPAGWTMPVCTVDLRVGGLYRYEWESANGVRMAMGGRFLEIEAPERLVNTQLFDEDWTGGEAIGTLLLRERDGRTEMTETVRYATAAARATALRTRMAEGLEAGFVRLDTLLASVPS